MLDPSGNIVLTLSYSTVWKKKKLGMTPVCDRTGRERTELLLGLRGGINRVPEMNEVGENILYWSKDFVGKQLKKCL